VSYGLLRSILKQVLRAFPERLTVAIGIPPLIGEVFLTLSGFPGRNDFLPAGSVLLPGRTNAGFAGHKGFSQ
jgi:hypothetical protein